MRAQTYLFVTCSSWLTAARSSDSRLGTPSLSKADRPRQRLRQRDRSGHRGRDRSPARSARTEDLLGDRRRDHQVARRHVRSRSTPTACSRNGASGRRSRTTACWSWSRPNEREMRIEVGYGLEGVLPDGLAGQVIRDDFTPRFREGDYSGGIRNGVPAPRRHRREAPGADARGDREVQRADRRHDIPILDRDSVLRPVRDDRLRHARHRPAHRRPDFPVLFGSFFGGMPLLMSLAFMAGVAVHAGAVGARRVRPRVSARRPAGVARRVSRHGGKAAADRRPAAGRWARRVQSSSSSSRAAFVEQLRRRIVGRRRGVRQMVRCTVRAGA